MYVSSIRYRFLLEINNKIQKEYCNQVSRAQIILNNTSTLWSRFRTRSYGIYGVHHDYVIKWKHFPRYWLFVRGIRRSPVNSPQRPVTRSFDVFFDLRLHTRLSKQWWGWWFEAPSRPLWRHCNDITFTMLILIWLELQRKNTWLH